jgi:hypothetical protein
VNYVGFGGALAVVPAGLTDQVDVDGWGDAALLMPVAGS